MSVLAALIRATLATSLCLLPLQPLLAKETKESRPGVYRGYSEARFTEWQKTSQYVAMSDGIKLAVDIYRPSVRGQPVAEKLPVVWIHTPYRRAYTDAKGNLVDPLQQLNLLSLLKHGYVVAAVDTRGRGASFGARRGFQDRTEARDAHEMTEWFAAQPWSTGEIGVAGCSYLGGSTWHAATLMSPHLKAIAPGCTDFDKYGFVSRGGITAQFNTRPENPGQDFGQGVLPVESDVDGKLAATAIAEHVKGTPMAELWAGMRYRDDVSPLLGVPFWREASVASYAQEIERSGVGIFIWGNWLDEGSFEATLAYNNLSNPRKLWMGEWGHCQVGDFPMDVELLRFFDHFLKKIDNGWQREAPIYYRTINAPAGQEWSSTDRWPLANARNQTLHLGGSATPGVAGSLTSKLTDKPAASDRFVVDYDPKCSGQVDLYFMMWPCPVNKNGLSYTTEPMTADTQVTGHPIADLWISSTTNDADIFVYLEDVAPTDTVAIVTHGRLRASHRGEQRAPYRNFLGVPFHRGERGDAEPLTPNEPARMRLDLLPTSTIVKAGHRLRLTIAGADPRQRSRNVKFDPAPTIHIHHDREHASQLTLPIVGSLKPGARGE